MVFTNKHSLIAQSRGEAGRSLLSLEELIEKIKSDFETEVAKSDKRFLKLNKLKGELISLSDQTMLFELPKKEKEEWNKKVNKLTGEIQSFELQIAEIKSNKIYENAFEWRFEFPEVLNNDGDFVGFDVVIGNPPYIRQEELSTIKFYLQTNYQTFAGTADLYVYFVERGMNIVRNNGAFIYILPNKWMRAGYGSKLRSWVKQFSIDSIIDFGDLPVFDEATTYPCLWAIKKTPPTSTKFNASIIDSLSFPNGLTNYVEEKKFSMNQQQLEENGWMLVNDNIQHLLKKIKSSGKPLDEYVDGKIFRGILTGYNEAFVIDDVIKNHLIGEDPRSSEIIKPFLAGRDIKRYQQPKSDKWLIFTRRGIDIERYPSILKHLEKHKDRLTPKPLDYKGNNWQGRKEGNYKWYEIQDASDYYEEFDKAKIIYPNICKQPEFVFDKSGVYTNQKCFIIISSDLYLMGLLNSRLIFFLFKMILPKLRGDFYEPSYIYLKDFPIIDAGINEKSSISSLVRQILTIKNQNGNTNTTSLESEIDRIVYELYGLTDEEIRIVEGG